MKTFLVVCLITCWFGAIVSISRVGVGHAMLNRSYKMQGIRAEVYADSGYNLLFQGGIGALVSITGIVLFLVILVKIIGKEDNAVL